MKLESKFVFVQNSCMQTDAKLNDLYSIKNIYCSMHDIEYLVSQFDWQTKLSSLILTSARQWKPILIDSGLYDCCLVAQLGYHFGYSYQTLFVIWLASISEYVIVCLGDRYQCQFGWLVCHRQTNASNSGWLVGWHTRL